MHLSWKLVFVQIVRWKETVPVGVWLLQHTRTLTVLTSGLEQTAAAHVCPDGGGLRHLLCLSADLTVFLILSSV